MNKRLVSRLMCEREAGIFNSGIYFFRRDFESILQGVVLEYVPRGLYIWNFRFPIFDFFGPHLSYSNRLRENAFIGNGEMSERAAVDFILESVEVRQVLDSDRPMSLTDFVKYLSSSGCLRNPHAQLIHAAALVLLGKESEAADLLRNLHNVLHPKDVNSSLQLKAAIDQSGGAAQELLGDVMRNNLEILGVHGNLGASD